MSRRRSQSGMTLVELSVGVLILGIVMAATLASFTSASRGSVGAGLRIENLNEAQLLMESASKDLRTAAPLVAGQAPFPTDPGNPLQVLATSDDVTFYADLNTSGVPNQVRLYVDRTDPKNPLLKETVLKPNNPLATPLTYNITVANPLKLRLVGQYIVNPSTMPVLSYEDDSGNILPVPLLATDATKVRAIDIQFQVRKQTNQAVKATTVINRVRLPNVIYSLLAGASS